MARLLVTTGFGTPVIDQVVFPGEREQDEEVVCESLVMSALRRSVEV
jgi:hypothetical protein